MMAWGGGCGDKLEIGGRMRCNSGQMEASASVGHGKQNVHFLFQFVYTMRESTVWLGLQSRGSSMPEATAKTEA